MLNYAVCEISGKQYKVIPNKAFEVSRLEGDGKNIKVKVLLLLSEDGKVEIGKPYLKEELVLERVEDIKGVKIRVSKFHAKANFRKTIGYRSKLTKVMLVVKKAVKS